MFQFFQTNLAAGKIIREFFFHEWTVKKCDLPQGFSRHCLGLHFTDSYQNFTEQRKAASKRGQLFFIVFKDGLVDFSGCLGPDLGDQFQQPAPGGKVIGVARDP